MSRTYSVLEAAVVRSIMARFKHIPGVVVRKRHGTPMGVAGDPDIYGSYRGQHFEIEVKRPNDPKSQLTKLQVQRQEEWRNGDALVGVARSVDEALAILGIRREVEPVWVCDGCHEYRWESDVPPARCPKCGHLHFVREVREAE